MGVVTAVKNVPPPEPGKKAKGSVVPYFELADESKVTLRCAVLDSNRDHYPMSLCCGDVVCLRRIAIEQDKGKLVARTSAITNWLLFSKQEDFKPSSSVANFSLSLSEKERLADLKDLADSSDAGES